MHINPAPQTPTRSQQRPQGSPLVQSVHCSSVKLDVSAHGLQTTTTTTANLISSASQKLDVSAHGLQTTTTANLISSASQEDHYWTVADDDFFQSDEFAQSLDAIYSPSNRYVTQNRSSNGKLAYVVFAGHDIGVFYNWAACATATKGFSNKVYKGFSSYNEAHNVWQEFVDHNSLPLDVINSLFGKPAPLPPSFLQPNIGGLAHPPSPTPIRTSQGPVLHSHDDLTLTLKTTLSTNQKSGSSDTEDFWVVITGLSPGVYQGREEGERALGPLASPSFLRIESREEANQIFVDEYMGCRVARFT